MEPEDTKSEGDGAGGTKQAVRLVEMGPRLRLRLLVVESGLFQGDLLLNNQTKQEAFESMQQKAKEKKLEAIAKKKTEKEDEKKLELIQKSKEEEREINRERENRRQTKKEKLLKKAEPAKKQTGKLIRKKNSNKKSSVC